jgi:hypothetical protein
MVVKCSLIVLRVIYPALDFPSLYAYSYLIDTTSRPPIPSLVAILQAIYHIFISHIKRFV